MYVYLRVGMVHVCVSVSGYGLCICICEWVIEWYGCTSSPEVNVECLP